MNGIDLLLLLVILISIIFALYRRSVSAFLGLVATIVSCLCALLVTPQVAAALSKNDTLRGMLTSYTDAASLVGDYSLSATRVVGMRASTLETVIKNVDLPSVFESLLRDNLASAAFSMQGLTTVNEYVSATIINTIFTIVSFVACFFICFLITHFFINLFDHVFHFSVLKHLDSLTSALCGLVRGIILLYIVFLLMPILNIVIPLDLITEYIGESLLCPFFTSPRLFLFIAVC